MRVGRILARIGSGLAAGAAATWIMNQLTTALYEREDPVAREREDSAREGKTAYGTAAERLARARGRELDDAERKKYGSLIHWALGIGAGGAYLALEDTLPGPWMVKGLVYGTGFWLLADELANPLLGLTRGPLAFPWQTHGRALAGHLVFGAVTAAVVSGLDDFA